MEINWNGSRLFYDKAGTGPGLLLFHGFGQDHSAFQSLVATVSDRYTCYSFDLFFHGNSTWKNEGEVLDLESWRQIISRFIDNENISHFSVLGFSIGARFALATFQSFPAMTRKLILVAPDGIRNHPLFTIATAFPPNRLVFKWVAHSPSAFSTLASLAKRTGLVPRSLVRFAESQMRTESDRLKVYHAWVTFRKLRFAEAKIAALLKEYHVKTFIFLAGNDRVIAEKRLQKFISMLDQLTIQTLEARHSHILFALARVFRSVVKG